jgi:hypothetical protein
MLEIIAGILYVIGLLLMMRMVALELIKEEERSKGRPYTLDGGDWTIAFIFGGLLWPVTWAGVVIYFAFKYGKLGLVGFGNYVGKPILDGLNNYFAPPSPLKVQQRAADQERERADIRNQLLKAYAELDHEMSFNPIHDDPETERACQACHSADDQARALQNTMKATGISLKDRKS